MPTYTMPDFKSPNWDVDLQTFADQVADDIAAAGTGDAKLRLGTRAERVAYTASAYNGLCWLETDYGLLWRYYATNARWELLADPTVMGALKNRLINGDFEYWERGLSFAPVSSTGDYNADRWLSTFITYTPTISRATFSLGQTDVPDNPKRYIQVTDSGITGVAGSVMILSQCIESALTLSGDSATLSLWGKADTDREIYVELAQSFGTGGSPSAQVNIAGTILSLTSSWQKFSHTFTIPSISGKTLGSNNNDYLSLNIWLAAGSDWDSRTGWSGGSTPASFTFSFSNVQLEQGLVDTGFMWIPKGISKLNCERFYKVPEYIPGFVASNTVARFFSPIWPAMRKAPTVSLTTSTPEIYAPTSVTGSGSALSSSLADEDGFYAVINGFTGLSAGNAAMLKTEGAITLDAEF